MTKLTKRKTGDAFAFTTSTAMGKRIRHEAKFKGLSVSEFIRNVVGKAVSPNWPVEGSSFLAVDSCPENEFEVINPKAGDRFQMNQSVEQWALTPIKLSNK